MKRYVPEKLLPYVGILKAVLANVDTKEHGFADLNNEINAEIAVMILSQYGLLTERAKDGQEGFEKVRISGEGYYDAVLMDIQMPVMNGYEASSAIRAMEGSYFKHVPIIAMSANAYDEDVRDSLRSGMNAHIAKPYQPEDLMAMLGRYIKA